jgi:hypothetical protein
MPPFRIELKIFALIMASRTGHVPVVQVRPKSQTRMFKANAVLTRYHCAMKAYFRCKSQMFNIKIVNFSWLKLT